MYSCCPPPQTQTRPSNWWVPRVGPLHFMGRRSQGRNTQSFHAPAPGCRTALSTLMSLVRETKGPFQHTERRAGKHPEDPNINSGSEATDLLLSEPLTRPEGKESARSFQKDPQPPPAPRKHLLPSSAFSPIQNSTFHAENPSWFRWAQPRFFHVSFTMTKKRDFIQGGNPLLKTSKMCSIPTTECHSATRSDALPHATTWMSPKT